MTLLTLIDTGHGWRDHWHLFGRSFEEERACSRSDRVEEGS